jgi:hypothetical protein
VAGSAEASIAPMRLRGRRSFHFERLGHFILTHFDSLILSPAGNSQPFMILALPDAFVARTHVACSPTSRPRQSLWGRHFPRSPRSSFIFLPTCPNDVLLYLHFRCLTCISLFTCFKRLLIILGCSVQRTRIKLSCLPFSSLCASASTRLCVHSSSIPFSKA